ncbi:hypothetical protein PV328_002457 [Microctonus aethiopoides]|uniref:Kinectin n=1 Tax=Microctonus aethiopoides TaxID=144406 RepID=A0AA39F6E1_9HYME|nr:hypothetical protein PV328_002457 [Microctonus aethiopoides]
MDLQTGLIYVGVVVVSAAVILFVSMFGIKEKSYEEAIAEQRKLPDDLLFAKKDKGKEKKHKSKTGKKVKEKKEDKDEKEEKPEHVQFEETPQILSPETNIQEACKGNKKKNKTEKVKPILVNKDESPITIPESLSLQLPLTEVNHFDVMLPKDELELIRTQSKENLHQIAQAEAVINKSPRETPTKSKKNVVKEPMKKKEEIKEEKKTDGGNVKESNTTAIQSTLPTPSATKEPAKEFKELQKDVGVSIQSSSTNKESKKNKKKNDILAQIGGDRDGINVSLLMPLVQKAELSRSEIQILIDQLLNKQLDNPMEHSEWTEGRADPIIKLKKQLAEKDKALAEEHEASVTFQNKLKELRSELNSERSRLTANVKQLEEALNVKITEAQTLHTRMQHILESHAAEKQGFARQIEQLQSKVNEDSAIIHKMQEDQGQTQGHLQQELIAQRKQLEVQFSQMRENENALKSQLAQKHVEVQELQNVNMNMTQELQATCESSAAEIEILRQQLAIMQDQCMHSEGQLKDAGGRLQDMARQLDEAHRAQADLDHRLKNAHRHEQELQKQLHSQQSDLKMFEVEANNVSALKAELNKLQNELMKFDYEAGEINKLRGALDNKEEEIKKIQTEFLQSQADVNISGVEMKKLELSINEKSNELNKIYSELAKAHEDSKQARNELAKVQRELSAVRDELSKATVNAKTANEASGELKLVKAELEKLQNGGKKSSADQIQITKLQEENDRLSSQIGRIAELQKELKRSRDENESLASQLASITERPAAEGRENGIDEKFEKNNVQHLQYTNSLAEKEKQLEALKAELLKNQTESNKLNSTIEILRRDVDNQKSLTARLQNDLEVQRSKNNENADRIKIAEQESTKSLLQRIFPEIKIDEQPYEKWIKTFEEQVHVAIKQKLQKENTQDYNLEIEKQNKNLQGHVAHYKQIILDTEEMLNNLQNHVESEESRWKSELRQQEYELVNLRLELKELQNKQASTHNLHEKISQLESRLKEEEKLREQAKAEVGALKSSKSPLQSGNFNLNEMEQLHEQKLRLLQELETERSKVVSLNSELDKLRQLRNVACAVEGSSGQTSLNGPKSDSSKNDEGGFGKK